MRKDVLTSRKNLPREGWKRGSERRPRPALIYYLRMMRPAIPRRNIKREVVEDRVTARTEDVRKQNFFCRKNNL